MRIGTRVASELEWHGNCLTRLDVGRVVWASCKARLDLCAMCNRV